MATRNQATMPLLPSREDSLLMLIDGHAMVHRSWHAISMRQHLTVGSTGEDITAVYGFTNTFLKAIQEWNPTHCAIAFDLPAPTFRHQMFAEYKAQRPESATRATGSVRSNSSADGCIQRTHFSNRGLRGR